MVTPNSTRSFAGAGAAGQYGRCGEDNFVEAGAGYGASGSGTVFSAFPDVRDVVDSVIDFFKCLTSRKC